MAIWPTPWAMLLDRLATPSRTMEAAVALVASKPTSDSLLLSVLSAVRSADISTMAATIKAAPLGAMPLMSKGLPCSACSLTLSFTSLLTPDSTF